MTKKTILITGGAGFIGSHVNALLHRMGYETVVLDNLFRGSEQAVTQGTFVQGDITNPADLKWVFDAHKIDGVIHLAALIQVGESMDKPGEYYKNNVNGTLCLLEAMKEHEIDKIVYSSSAAIFGLPKTEMIAEDHPKEPISPYGRTKWMCEQILEDYGVKSISLRYFNAAGGDPEGEVKNCTTFEQNLIPIALRSDEVTIFGTDYETPDGTCIRDYIHVYDLANVHVKALERLLDGGESNQYNLGNGEGFSVREVLAAIEEVTGKKLKLIEGPRRPCDPPKLVASSQKVQEELGWQPQHPHLTTIISHAWEAIAHERIPTAGT